MNDPYLVVKLPRSRQKIATQVTQKTFVITEINQKKHETLTKRLNRSKQCKRNWCLELLEHTRKETPLWTESLTRSECYSAASRTGGLGSSAAHRIRRFWYSLSVTHKQMNWIQTSSVISFHTDYWTDTIRTVLLWTLLALSYAIPSCNLWSMYSLLLTIQYTLQSLPHTVFAHALVLYTQCNWCCQEAAFNDDFYHMCVCIGRKRID